MASRYHTFYSGPMGDVEGRAATSNEDEPAPTDVSREIADAILPGRPDEAGELARLLRSPTLPLLPSDIRVISWEGDFHMISQTRCHSPRLLNRLATHWSQTGHRSHGTGRNQTEWPVSANPGKPW